MIEEIKPYAVRAVVPADVSNLKAVIDSSELFPSEMIEEMIAPYFAQQEECLWLTGDQDGPSFVAYCAPEKMTEGTWNLFLIAVHADRQGQGIGRSVLAHIEAELQKRGVRLLLVDTSGLDEFKATRSFYYQCGYLQEAVIRDFYQQGEDKVTFVKRLN
ncbi:GNAT family N-acetyltransferase [Persicobacter psychrovividus]|uniref:GNAT family N-acetyltransferase n=1 Tax=Persicobacter psychrovividus TaxID=387638 RepID=A0ABM7VFC7_9BACT|nr:GNAT family N-acetyltransferase [Persicobacter psychrovividus]